MTPSHPIVFLIDIDNTLLDNDAIQQDLKDHLERSYGRAARERRSNNSGASASRPCSRGKVVMRTIPRWLPPSRQLM